MNHAAFSMQTILNEPIDPFLCRKILEEIKSPLLEQSFALTNDQSFNNSYTNIPKRPYIPPLTENPYQSRRPAIKSKYSTYDQNYYNTQSRYVSPAVYTENRSFLQDIKNTVDKNLTANANLKFGYDNKTIESKIQGESVVSPLDPTITMRNHNQLKQEKDFWGNMCGDLLNVNGQSRNQIYYDTCSKTKYQRRKIFSGQANTLRENFRKNEQDSKPVVSILLVPEQRSHISIKQEQEQKAKIKTVKQVTQQLRNCKHYEVADFIAVITSIIDSLKKTEIQRIYLIENVQMLYQLTNASNSQMVEFAQDDKNCKTFLGRMNFNSIFDMIKQLSKAKLIKGSNNNIKDFNKQRNKVSESLERMIESFSQLQQCVSQFLEEKDAIQKLKQVHCILREKFTNKNTKSTYDQLLNMLKDLKLFQYEKDLIQLQYIWEGFNEESLSQNEFITGFVRSNGVYRDDRSQKEDGFDNQMSKMGFTRN